MPPRNKLELPHKLRAELEANGALSVRPPRRDSNPRPAKRPRLEKDQPARQPASSKPAKYTAAPSKTPPPAKKEQTPLEKLLVEQGKGAAASASARKSARTPRTPAEKDEDDEIAWLESHLGVGKSSWKDELEQDGLDDLFADLDRFERDEPLASESAAPSDEEEDDIDEQEVDGEELSEAEEDSASVSEVDEMGDDEWTGFDNEADQSPTKETPTEVEAAPSTRYIPPHLRKAASAPVVESSAASENIKEAPPSDPRLRRLLLGHLNKLSSANMPVILPQIEAVYRSHPRAIVSAQLADLLLELVASRDAMGETFLIVYAVLVAALSRTVGKELGAIVVARSIEVYDGAEVADLTGTTSARPGPKERTNVVAFLAELYNCQVVACTLIYDLVRSLIDAGLGEAEVEMLLKVVKVSGPQLRQDDPTALKQIIQLVQEAQKQKDASMISSRSRFMIETLSNLRNNRLKSEATSAADATVSLKKYLANLARQRTLSIPEPLRLTLDDLRASSTKGKWWLVGAAWGGDPLVDAKAERNGATSKTTAAADAETWSKLARQQGMNTDVRRSIFVALMSSEDYVDACDRISQLALKEVQQREIVRVILQCTGNEKAYNPFYTLVMQRLIASSPKTAHSYQITLQYALWDLLRDMGETSVGGTERLAAGSEATGEPVSSRKSRNTARAYGWWLAKGTLSLTILKPLPFGMLQDASTAFLRHLFSALLLSTQSTSPALSSSTAVVTRRDGKVIGSIFEKMLSSGSKTLIRGVRGFLESEIGPRADAAGDEVLSWACGVACDVLEQRR